jgi:hypothetical protein
MSPGVQPHTATQQWQSFEIRMRRRRIERCLLRASVAIEVGVLDEARAALEEVQRLDPREPGIGALEAQLASAEASVSTPSVEESTLELPLDLHHADPLAEEAPRQGHALLYVAAVFLIAMSGATGWWWMSSGAAVSPVPVQTAAALPTADRTATVPSPPSERGVQLSESAVTAPTSTEARSDEPVVATAGIDEPLPAAVVPIAERVEPSALPDAAPPAVNAPIAAPPSPTATVAERPGPVAPLVEPAPAPGEPAPPPPVAVAGTDGVALSDTAVSLNTPAAVPAAASSPVPSTQSDERLVRATLSRYEGAYSTLDAAAARAVWPGVDQRALTNAFQGLSAQDVSLGRCDIRISGATAQAECRGTARWTPKVGGGPQTAARQWRFDLRNAGGDWIITRATVR